ncbi:MBL fold metallo-hydrolase [Sporobolomyces salmoneus]|uniref:MBL fold metallo-hydrolase n=1 Tax=Sporobolomyces salmoneus TaxID=183962 RepID=UPI00316B4CFA
MTVSTTSSIADTLRTTSIASDSKSDHPPLQDLSLLLLGTGTSSSLPSIGCLTNPVSGCWCCRSTLLKDDPKYATEYRKNERRNISGMLRIPTPPQPGTGRTERTVLIDCGKSFFSGALEWWPKKGLREIDAVLLTHAHADAILGLDDLRGWTLRGHIQPSIPIYCTQETYDGVSQAFPYLTNTGKATGGGDIPALEWRVIDPVAPFDLFGIQVVPLPVEHGKFFTTPPKPFLCSGFLFNRQICYLSDVSSVPSSVYRTLSHYVDLPTSPSVTGVKENGLESNGHGEEEGEGEGKKPKLQVLIVDCLRLEEFTSHYGLGKAVETIRKLGAKRNYLIGFGHRTSHTAWLKACELLSTPNSTSGFGSLTTDAPTFNDLYNGHPDPLQEDPSNFARRALQVVENWEKARGANWGKGERPWVRPSCDGMTITVGRDGRTTGDDEYQ